MKIKVINIIIARDPMTKIPKTVKPWEVPIFRSKFGDENVTIVGEPVTVEVDDADAQPDAQEEYFRLRLQFGIDSDTKQSHADIAYGRGQEGIDNLAKAIKASKAGDVEAAQKIVDGGKPSPEAKEVREGNYRDPLSEEFADQSNNDVIGAAAGGPGAAPAAGDGSGVDVAGGAKSGKGK